MQTLLSPLLARRRALLTAGAALLARPAAAALPVPPAGSLAFRIDRQGSTIGSHTLRFERSAADLIVRIAVDIAVGLGPIVLFRFRLRATETWRDDVLQSASAETDDNGTPQRMTAQRGPEGLVVEGTRAPRYVAPPGAITASHWNRAELDHPTINPQDGRLLTPGVRRVGEEAVALASGAKVDATRYTVTGEAVLDLWYDGADQWTALRFHAKDAPPVEYYRT